MAVGRISLGARAVPSVMRLASNRTPRGNAAGALQMTKEQMIAHARALQEIVSDEEMARRVGEQIAQLLQLKRKRNGRYDTSGGDKTDCGLGRTVARVIADTLTDSTPSMTAREADKRDLQALGAWGIQR